MLQELAALEKAAHMHVAGHSDPDHRNLLCSGGGLDKPKPRDDQGFSPP